MSVMYAFFVISIVNLGSHPCFSKNVSVYVAFFLFLFIRKPFGTLFLAKVPVRYIMIDA